MRPRPLVYAISALGAALAVSPAAWAQTSLAGSPQLQLTSTSGLTLETLSSGTGRQLTTQGLASGLKLGESAILHAALFADIGYDTNVLYTNQDSRPAAVLHVGPRLSITNAERDGTRPSGIYYDVFAGLDWRKYLSDDEDITDQDAINPSVGGALELSSGQTLSVLFTENFVRYTQAPYSAGEPIVRDDNLASVGLRYAPGGGRLMLSLRYANLIDYYEGAYRDGSNMGNELLLDAGWRWLPKTSIYVQVAQGVVSYFNGDKPTSYPLRTMAGLRGLLTEKLSLNLGAGYSNAFYSSGDNPSGFGNVGIVAEVNYAIDLLSRAGVGYRHDFVNSPFVGQFYDMDAVYAVYQQLIASRVATYLYGRYENRRFRGVVDPTTGAAVGRTDNYLMGGVAVDYMIGKFFLIGASYSVSLNRTDHATGVASGIDYTKQTLLFRLGLVY